MTLVMSAPQLFDTKFLPLSTYHLGAVVGDDALHDRVARKVDTHVQLAIEVGVTALRVELKLV